MPKTRKFFVYFSQINQERIEVEATSPSKAIKKAQREWQRDNAVPSLIGIEERDK